MQGRWTLAVVALGAASLLACDDGGPDKTIRLTPEAVDCPLTMDTLADTQWIIERINADKSTTPDLRTRMRFFKEGEELKVKYNVSSLSDVYTYNCKRRGEEWFCAEEPKLRDWCQALVTGGAECTPEALKQLAPDVTDEQVAKAIAEANDNMNRFKNTDNWKAFVFQNNNLGNKLQGLLYVKLEQKSCKLRITDNYMTLYNGKRMEDSNPVGTNLFVRNDEELMFEHCSDSTDLVALKQKEWPKTPEAAQTCAPPGCTFTNAEEVHYHYVGQDGRTPKEGCTYSYDAWVDWKPAAKDVAAVVEGTELRWQYSVQHKAPGTPVFEMVRYATCGGAKEKLETSCNIVRVD